MRDLTQYFIRRNTRNYGKLETLNVDGSFLLRIKNNEKKFYMSTAKGGKKEERKKR